MEDDDTLPNPASYPKNGTYSDLLYWHLKIWGTGNGGDLTKPGTRWNTKLFLKEVFGDGGDIAKERVSLAHWLGKNGPPKQPTDEKVENALFGAPPAFHRWRMDLRNAYDRSHGKHKDGSLKNKRTVKFGPVFEGSPTTGHFSNIISVGGRTFTHRQLHKQKAEPANINELLRTDIRATSLVERTEELAMLAGWRDAPQDIAVKCVIGAAGAGKTRLAIEACEAAETAGWFATFIPSSELSATNMTLPSDGLIQPRQTLIVVDYAATSAKALKSWFDGLALRRIGSDHKLRILLLERHADRQYGWWADLLRPDSKDHACAADIIGGEIPYVLPPLDAVRHRRALLAEVMLKAAPLFDPPRPALTLPAPGVDLWFDQRLAENRHDNEPLYLMMAGVCAVESGVATALAMNRLARPIHETEVPGLLGGDAFSVM